MLTRQKALLIFLELSDGQAGRLELVKKAFLLRMESPSRGGSAFYDFVPYQYGPFSFVLYQEMNSLARTGYVETSDDKSWSITPLGREISHSVNGALRGEIADVLSRVNGLSLEELVDQVYETYPWFTQNAGKMEKRRLARPTTSPGIYTMGYAGLSVDEFLNRLIRNGITMIVDVRNNPVSMRYGFHKGTLQRLAGNLGIDYQHFPELGIPSEFRRNLDTQESYENLFRKYRGSMLPAHSSSVEQIASILSEKPAVLICSEADPNSCHRSHLAEAVAKRRELPVCHLEWPR